MYIPYHLRMMTNGRLRWYIPSAKRLFRLIGKFYVQNKPLPKWILYRYPALRKTNEDHSY